MRRQVATALASPLAGNGLAMLFAGRWWYGAVPGVTEFPDPGKGGSRAE